MTLVGSFVEEPLLATEGTDYAAGCEREVVLRAQLEFKRRDAGQVGGMLCSGTSS